MNFMCSVVPSFLRRQIFFESLQFAQPVVYKSSYLLKYGTKVMSSLGEYEKFFIALQMVICEKENSFSMRLLWLVSSKTCFWNSSCLSWFSFWVCRSNFSCWERSCFCHFSSILSLTCNCYVFWYFTRSNKILWKSSICVSFKKKKNRKICNLA